MEFTTRQPLQHAHEALHERLRQATQAGGEVVAFADARVEHARTEEEVMHPAAVPVGPSIAMSLHPARHRAGGRTRAPAAVRQAFAEAWQGWVRTTRLERAYDPAVIARIA